MHSQRKREIAAKTAISSTISHAAIAPATLPAISPATPARIPATFPAKTATLSAPRGEAVPAREPGKIRTSLRSTPAMPSPKTATTAKSAIKSARIPATFPATSASGSPLPSPRRGTLRRSAAEPPGAVSTAGHITSQKTTKAYPARSMRNRNRHEQHVQHTVERETGLEPATPCLEGARSTHAPERHGNPLQFRVGSKRQISDCQPVLPLHCCSPGNPAVTGR